MAREQYWFLTAGPLLCPATPALNHSGVRAPDPPRSYVPGSRPVRSASPPGCGTGRGHSVLVLGADRDTIGAILTMPIPKPSSEKGDARMRALQVAKLAQNFY